MNKPRTTSSRKLQIINEPYEEALQLDMFNFVSDYALADVSLSAKKERLSKAMHSHARPLQPASHGHVDLNKTFLNLCQGDSNQVAVEAVKRFVQQDNITYRMLYLQADSGLGKTHILHAAANELRLQNKIFYMSSPLTMFPLTENFNKLKDYSYLLIDDMEGVEGIAELQKIFCQLMDYAQAGVLKIIFTSSKSPRDYHGCTERLKGKLSAALAHEISPINQSLARTIINTKCHSLNFELPETLKDLIAQNLNYNVYGVESMLLKLKSRSEITDFEATTRAALLEMAPKIIPLTNESHEELFKIVANAFQIELEDLTSNIRRKSFALARHVSMFILKEKKGLSLKRISNIFGNDHTTVIYAIARIKREEKRDQILRDKIQKIMQEIS